MTTPIRGGSCCPWPWSRATTEPKATESIPASPAGHWNADGKFKAEDPRLVEGSKTDYIRPEFRKEFEGK